MAKISSYENLIKTVNESSSLGFKRGLGFLYTEDEVLNGRQITLNGKKLVNFGSCGYLGLEIDPRLKEAAIDAIKKFGTYYSSSRTYVSCGNYRELELLVEKMFGTHIVLTTNSTIGHHCVMPIVIGGNDLVVYDQQAHISMHELSYKLRHYGSEITILRHNRLDELETKIVDSKGKYDKIWYVVDGVFSMFGDLPDTKKIISLLDKYKKLHLYVDDAHGMSWAGPNGSGYTLSQTPFHPKMVLGTSMAKGFGSCGGVFAFYDKESADRVKGWGGPLTYSGPQEPATVAAAIASAKIHLSDEIYALQKSLEDKIAFCNHVMDKYKVPLISNSLSPIFFVGMGLQKVAYNLVQRIIGEGLYTNIAVFPAVPETCCGMRFTITNHLSFEDIENLAKSIAVHLPKVLKEEERSIHDIFRAFRKFTDLEKRYGNVDYGVIPELKQPVESSLTLKTYKTIKDIDKKLWDDMFSDKGAFDHNILSLYEEVFSNNPEPENNWNFFYYIVEENGKVVLATFFTSALSKDDMLAPAEVSKKVEEMRQNDPYYLTSNCMMMGSLLTNGEHLFLNRENSNWKKAFELLMDEVWKEQDRQKASVLFYRDFNMPDEELRVFMVDHGFIKLANLDNNIIQNIKNFSLDDYINNKFNKKKRYYLRNDILPYENLFETSIIEQFNEDQLNIFYNLYLNVKEASLNLNTFNLPKKLFSLILNNDAFELLQLKIKATNMIASIVFCYKTSDNYCPLIIGMNKDNNPELNVYKQTIYQIIKRALQLNTRNIHLGLTASETKYMLGADNIAQMGFAQMKDHFNQSFLETMK